MISYSLALYARLAGPIIGPEALRILLSLLYISLKEWWNYRCYH